MRYRKLDADDDYQFGNGLKDFHINIPEAVGQACVTRVKLIEGEWFLDLSDGTAMFTGVMGKRSKEQADNTIRRRLQLTQGFTGIAEFDSSINGDNREYKVRCSIDTIYGPTSLDRLDWINF